MIDHLEVLHPLLGRREVHAKQCLQILEKVGRYEPSGLESVARHYLDDNFQIALLVEGVKSRYWLLEKFLATALHNVHHPLFQIVVVETQIESFKRHINEGNIAKREQIVQELKNLGL